MRKLIYVDDNVKISTPVATSAMPMAISFLKALLNATIKNINRATNQ